MEKKNTFWTEMARPVVVLVVICLVASALLGLTNAKTAVSYTHLTLPTNSRV